MPSLWHNIDARQMPSRAVAVDEMRPSLTMGHIRNTEEGCFLYCSDAYILAEIPISPESRPSTEEVAPPLPEVAIPREGLEALDGRRRFRIHKGHLEVDGTAARYPVNSKIGAPDFGSLLAKGFDSGAEERQPVETLRFDPKLLQRLIEALGAGGNIGVELLNVGPNKAIPVRAMAGDKFGRGLLMPLRSKQ